MIPYSFIYACLAVAGLSMLLTRSQALQPFRERVNARSHYLGELVGCAYCMSHWVAIVVVLLASVRTTASGILGFIVSVFSIVAVSTIIIGLMDRMSYRADVEIRELRRRLNEATDTIEQLVAD